MCTQLLRKMQCSLQNLDGFLGFFCKLYVDRINRNFNFNKANAGKNTVYKYKLKTVHIKLENEDYLEGSNGRERAIYGQKTTTCML